MKKKVESSHKKQDDGLMHQLTLTKVFLSDKSEKTIENLIRAFIIQAVKNPKDHSKNFQPLAYLLANKVIRFKLNHCMMMLLEHFPSIK